MNAHAEAKYRPNVAAIVLSPRYPMRCEFFIGRRTDVKDAWQFPQGGIDEGETPREALFRELKEEIGTDNVDVVAEYPTWVCYDFPESIAPKMYPYTGQMQKYFLVRLKQLRAVNLQTEVPEFDSYRFVSYATVLQEVTYFKRPIYKQILEYFKKGGYL